MTRARPSWALQAACRDHEDLDLWHRHESIRALSKQAQAERDSSIAAAKAICATCPVREACLEHALANFEAYGIWGGMTAYERRKELEARGHSKQTEMRNARPARPKAKAACGTPRMYQNGCRCDACRHAERARKRAWEKANRYRQQQARERSRARQMRLKGTG